MAKTVKIDLPPEGFIRDLCALDGSHGGDERDKAYEYFHRCGYGAFR